MSAIGKGDWLQAVKAWPACDWVVVGNVYVVEDLVLASACADCGSEGLGIALVGDPDEWSAWCSCFFRPLKPPGDEVQTAEAPTPELEAA